MSASGANISPARLSLCIFPLSVESSSPEGRVHITAVGLETPSYIHAHMPVNTCTYMYTVVHVGCNGTLIRQSGYSFSFDAHPILIQ